MMVRLVRGLGWACFGLGVLLTAGFGWFVWAANRPAAAPPHADGIVVLTGGADRVETAVRLLQAGAGDKLLVSGVARGTALQDLGRRLDFDPASVASQVTLGHTATSTFGNAGEAAAWVAANRLHSVIVVTAGYHMERAMLELRRAMPAVALYPLPVVHAAASWRLLAVEYLKFLAACCGVSQAFDAREHPVGKFVSG